MTLSEVEDMPSGKERRKLLLELVKAASENGSYGIPVNCKSRIQTKNDRDIKYLLKKKRVVQRRMVWYTGTGQTYICLPCAEVPKQWH